MEGRIGKYVVERELGRGGFGKVYLAFDPDVGQPVAIKKLLADGDVDLLKRFQLEIRTTAGLRHKNIVTIHASGEEDGDPYLVMEFLEGQTLKQIMQQHKPLSLLDKVRIMTQVAEGLAYAHSKGVVHRDVKPENIMLLPDDNVKIMDFGIALGPNRNTNVTQTGGIIGTPAYFAPEQLEGFKATQQTDIFSFGDVYYELLTGVHPFEQYKNDWKTLQIAIMSYEPRALGDLMPGCPEALETMVHRTLAKEPEFRYQRFEEVQLDSEAILVDLKHEGAAAILREIAHLEGPENLQTALSKINQAYQLAPGNREVRRRRDELNLLIQKEQVRTRVSKLMADADSQMAEKRYAEAVQSLETAVKLDSTNTIVRTRLDEAAARRDGYVRATRLISEARFRQQKGLLTEAEDLLQEALAIDPDHTEAVRLSRRVREELERRKRQQGMQTARDHLAAGRFTEALAVLGTAEDPPGTNDLADLRAEIQLAQAEEERRVRAERLNLAAAKTRETMEAGDLDRASQMVDRLAAHFASDPGAPEVLRGLRERLEALGRVREIAQYQQRVQSLLEGKSYREALDLLGEALRRFPGDTGLERLNKSADELYRAQQRFQAIAAVLKEAAAMRDEGDLQGALASVTKGRQTFGDEAAFVSLARDLEFDIEKQRYRTALDSLLRQGRELLAAGKYSDIARLDPRGEFAGEAEVRALREAARVAAAIEAERRFAEETLAAAGKLQSEGKWTQALGAVEQGLARYPQNSSLLQAAQPLRDRVEAERRRATIERHSTLIRQEIQSGEWKRAEAAIQKARTEFPGERVFDELAEQAQVERRRSLIERHRTSIRQEIQSGEWKRAEAALQKARTEFPGEPLFDELAAQVQSGLYEAGWRELETRVNQHLAAHAISQAEAKLGDPASRAMYAGDPRWAALAENVARQRGYEEALREAEQHRMAGHLSEAERLLTEVIKQGPPDRRADQMRGAIQVQRTETLRQQAIARIAQGIRELLTQDDLPKAESELAAARTRYPGETAWGELQAGLDAKQQVIRRRAAAIERYRTLIRQQIKGGEWKLAEAAIQQARAEFPGERVFDDLAEQVQLGLYESGWRELETRVNQHLAANSVSQAAARLEDQSTRTMYAGDPRWAALAEGVAKQHGYEEALREAERQRSAGRLSEAENLLTEVIKQGPPDRRADQMRGAIQMQRTETLRQQAVARIAESIREHLNQDDVAKAESELAAARTRYPGETAWDEIQSDLDARQQVARRRAASIERHRGAIRQEVQSGQWKPAEAALQKARAEFPGERVFDDLAAQVQSGLYEAGWSELEKRVNRDLAANAIPQAEAKLGEQASRTVYAADPRLSALTERVARQRDYEGALREAEQHRIAGQLSEAERLLTEAIKQGPPDRRADQMRGAIQVQRTEALRQQAVARIAGSIREHLAQDDLAQAGPELAAARTRYPGETAWDELQADLDAREQLARRKADIAAAEQSVRESLDRGGVRQAAAALIAARAKYPSEPAWATLEAEINARQAALDRLYEIGLAGENIRRRLSRTHSVDDLNAGPVMDRCEALLHRRREDLRPALSELDAARVKYPGEPRWDALQAEIAARGEFLDAESAIAERVNQCLDQDGIAEAQTQLAAARAKYPDDYLWNIFQTEIDRREELRKSREEIARIAAAVRDRLDRDDLREAAAQLAAARAKYPQEGAWAPLKAEIDSRQAALEREAAIAAAAESIRGQLDRGIRDVLNSEAEAPLGTYPIKPVWDVLRGSATQLDQARAKYPGEGLWETLASEIAERQRQVEHEIAEIVRACSDIFPLDWNARQLAESRQRYPDEPFWQALQAEIDARRETLDRASIAEFQARIAECLKRDDFETAIVRLNAARKRHAGAKLWEQLQADVDAGQRRVKRREDLDAMERSVRAQLQRVAEIPQELDRSNLIVLQWEAFGKAAAALFATRSKYPEDDRLAGLQAETDSRRAQWQRDLAQSVSEAIRSHPHPDTVKWLAPQIRTLRQQDPYESLWAMLEAEIQALEALLKRQGDVAAAGERVRQVLKRGDVRQAGVQLDAARAKYPGEALWSALQAEIDARKAEIEEARRHAEALLAEGRPAEAITLIESRFGQEPDFAELLARGRAAIEEQKRREARGQTRDRLLAIEQQVDTETRKRKRKELDGEAQRLIASYLADQELAAIAARIHARVEAPPAAGPVPPKAIPWKPIGIGVSAAAVVGVVLIVALHKSPGPPKPSGPATVSMEIRTEPSGASLRVGDRTCIANCTLELAPGTYRLDAQLQGYQPKHQTIVVDSSNRLVDVRLDPEASPASSTVAENPSSGAMVSQTARVELSGAPANVELRLDAKPAGRTNGSAPLLLEVKPGNHALEVAPGLLQLGQNSPSRSLKLKFESRQTIQLAWKPEPTSGTEGRSGTGSIPAPPPSPKTSVGSPIPTATVTPPTATPGPGTVPAPKEDPEQRDWDKVHDTSSPAQLRDFRGRYPGGKHAKEAEDALDRLVWASANNPDSLRSYLQDFPNGAHRGEAASRIDELTWKAVDQKDSAGLQKFLKENPGNPHRAEAQKVLDQLASIKQEAEKQGAKNEAEKKAILAVVTRFNAAFEHGSKRELSALWPGALKSYLDAVDTSHRGAIKLDAPSNIEIAGDAATLSCNVVSAGKAQPVKITLQKRVEGWTIVMVQKV